MKKEKKTIEVENIKKNTKMKRVSALPLSL